MSFVYKQSQNGKEFRCNLICKQCMGHDTKRDKRCTKKSCFALPYCHEHLAKNAHLVIKPSGIQDAGLGLFALRDFMKHEYIIEYIGLKWTQEQINAIYGDSKFDFAPYAIKLGDDGYYVDAACFRSVAAMANDARSRSKNNATFRLSLDAEQVFVVAKKLIKSGEEIFVSYGAKYWQTSAHKHRSTFATLPSRIKNPTSISSLGTVMQKHTNTDLLRSDVSDTEGGDVSASEEGEDCEA